LPEIAACQTRAGKLFGLWKNLGGLKAKTLEIQSLGFKDVFALPFIFFII